jgi:hypothetical protein
MKNISIESVKYIYVGKFYDTDKETSSRVDHGIYTVTNAGSGGAPFVLTRATDYDQNAEVMG